MTISPPVLLLFLIVILQYLLCQLSVVNAESIFETDGVYSANITMTPLQFHKIALHQSDATGGRSLVEKVRFLCSPECNQQLLAAGELTVTRNKLVLEIFEAGYMTCHIPHTKIIMDNYQIHRNAFIIAHVQLVDLRFNRVEDAGQRCIMWNPEQHRLAIEFVGDQCPLETATPLCQMQAEGHVIASSALATAQISRKAL